MDFFQRNKSFLLLTIVLWSLLALGTRSICLQHQNLDLLSQKPEDGSLYGGNDWITWKNTEKGVEAVSIHPLMRQRQKLEGASIEEGDILRKIDFLEVWQAETVDLLIHRSPPGKVFIYTVDRKDPGSFSGVIKSFFVRNSYQPQFAVYKNVWLWNLFVWLPASGTLISLVSLLILFPILRTHLKRNWPILAAMALSMLCFFVLLARHLYLLVETDLTRFLPDRNFTLIFAALLSAYAVVYLLSHLKTGLKGIAVPVAIAGIGLVFMTLKALLSGEFWLYSQLVKNSVMAFFTSLVFFSLIASLLERWKERSRADQLFHVIALAFSGGLGTIWGGKIFSLHFLPDPGEGTLFLSMGAIAIPLVNLAAGELKFGKVSVVLTRTIFYLIFALFALFFAFALHEVLIYAGLEIRYQYLLEIALLILVFFALQSLYLSNQHRLRQYFISTQQEKRDHFNQFISLIPQYTSSEKLTKDLSAQLQIYLGTERVCVWMKEDSLPLMLENFSEEKLTGIAEHLIKKTGFWARNSQLSEIELPPAIDQFLTEAQFFQVHPIAVKEDQYGLLFLGRKKQGVYNLGDVELLSRVIQQTRLTLDVLDLVEREKMLLEKNYEANLTALRSQINPHFLFNTLNTISALVHDAPDDAEKAVEKLAFIFRYTLKHSSQNLVTFKDELSLVLTYLEIEQMRFGTRMELRYEVEQDVLEYTLPAFVIQTLIENCVKHGIAKIIDKGVISIQIKKETDAIICRITDNGPGIDLTKIHSSTGLNNISTRLQEIYHIKNLLYFENTGNGTLVIIKIPILS